MILTQHLHFFLRLTGAAFYLLTFKVLVLQMQIVQLCDFFCVSGACYVGQRSERLDELAWMSPIHVQSCVT